MNELWRPVGGAYNVDNVLNVMVSGLEQELNARMDGKLIHAMKGNYPSPTNSDPGSVNQGTLKVVNAEFLSKVSPKQIAKSNNGGKIQQQGGDISMPVRKVLQWMVQYRLRRAERKQARN